jgi:hypothetical protein
MPSAQNYCAHFGLQAQRGAANFFRASFPRACVKHGEDKYMIDPKLNDLPVDAEGDFADVPESSLTEEQKAERRKRGKAGLSINETVARDANLSVGARGVDTSGVQSGAGAGAGLTNSTPAAPDENPEPEIVKGPRGSGMTPRGDTDFR